MGILHFSQFSLIFYVIQWESCNFSLFCKFSMLFNGKLVFCQFPMLFNGTDGPTYGCLEIHPCVLQDIGPLGPLPKKGLIFHIRERRISITLSVSNCQSKHNANVKVHTLELLVDLV